ncbi:E3 ubiquitin-protein ligase XIAP [Armadillidium vulgare]|nr:E3 ubiquitin-protein ligase XIAP [Armadillidium vulgare]
MNIADTDKRIPTPRALLFEYFRLKTFQFFPGKNPDHSGLAEKSEVTFNFIKPHYKNLVKRGYYYDRLTNDVRCYFCPSILAKKEHYAEALEHEKNFSCKMALYPLNGNVPLKDEDSDSEDSLVQINYFFQSIVITKEIYKVINNRTVIDFDKRLVRSDVEILFPNGVDSDDLSNYDVRLATFDPWFPYLDETEKPDKEKFAKAGFVYTGYSDIVMCFSCKKGLFNLEKLDDPERYHVEFYKGCSFIRENFLIVEDNANRIGVHKFKQCRASFVASSIDKELSF